MNYNDSTHTLKDQNCYLLYCFVFFVVDTLPLWFALCRLWAS